MKNDTHAVKRFLHERAIADIAAKKVSLGTEVLRRIARVHLRDQSVEHPDLMTLFHERIDKMRADEPGAACDQYLFRHVSSLRFLAAPV